MKKIIGVVAVIALISMIGTVISFFALDYYKISTAQNRWKTQTIIIGEEKVAEKIEDALEDGITAAEDMGEAVEEAAESIAENAERAAEDIVNSLLESRIYDFTSEIVDKAVDGSFYGLGNAFRAIGEEDGYLTREIIEQKENSVLRSWTQEMEGVEIKKIKADLANFNIVLARTREKAIEVHLTGTDKSAYELQIGLVPEAEYHILDKKKRINWSGGIIKPYTLYLLLPDEYKGEIDVDIVNGNVVAIWQKNDMEIDLTNGNVVLDQKQNTNLSIEITNGNIIVDTADKLDAEVEIEVTNGMIIGFDFLKETKGISKKYKKIYGNGRYEMNLNVVNGTIIGNAAEK